MPTTKKEKERARNKIFKYEVKKLKYANLFLLLFSVAFIPLLSQATTVYKSVDKAGNITFSTMPSKEAIPITIQQPQTISFPQKSDASNKHSISEKNKDSEKKRQIQIDSELLNKQIAKEQLFQQKISQAATNLQIAKRSYQLAVKKMTIAKRELYSLINQSSKTVSARGNVISRSNNQGAIYTLSQKAVLAEQQKDLAYQKLSQAKETLSVLKQEYVTFMQSQ